MSKPTFQAAAVHKQLSKLLNKDWSAAFKTATQIAARHRDQIQAFELVDFVLCHDGCTLTERKRDLARLAAIKSMIALNPSDSPEVYLQADYFGGLHALEFGILTSLAYDSYDLRYLVRGFSSIARAIAAHPEHAALELDEKIDAIEYVLARVIDNDRKLGKAGQAPFDRAFAELVDTCDAMIASAKKKLTRAEARKAQALERLGR